MGGYAGTHGACSQNGGSAEQGCSVFAPKVQSRARGCGQGRTHWWNSGDELSLVKGLRFVKANPTSKEGTWSTQIYSSSESRWFDRGVAHG